MYRKDVPPSGLPSFMLPCPKCGHRLMFTSVEPARLGGGASSNDLEDIIYSCVQCGTTLIRTMRSPSAAVAGHDLSGLSIAKQIDLQYPPM